MCQRKYLGLIALFLTLCVVGWLLYTRSARDELGGVAEAQAGVGTQTLSSTDERFLQDLAIESCRCAGKTGDPYDRECWSGYEAAIAKYEHSSVASTCMPISFELDCIETESGEVCISTGFGIAGVCTPDEAAAIDQAWQSAYDETIRKLGGKSGAAMDAAFQAANATIGETVDRIRSGETIALTDRGGGCSG